MVARNVSNIRKILCSWVYANSTAVVGNLKCSYIIKKSVFVKKKYFLTFNILGGIISTNFLRTIVIYRQSQSVEKCP